MTRLYMRCKERVIPCNRRSLGRNQRITFRVRLCSGRPGTLAVKRILPFSPRCGLTMANNRHAEGITPRSSHPSARSVGSIQLVNVDGISHLHGLLKMVLSSHLHPSRSTLLRNAGRSDEHTPMRKVSAIRSSLLELFCRTQPILSKDSAKQP